MIVKPIKWFWSPLQSWLWQPGQILQRSHANARPMYKHVQTWQMLWQQPGHLQQLEKQLALWSDLSIMNVCPCSLPVNWQVDSAKSAWLVVTGIDSQTAQISRSSLQTPLIGLPKLLLKQQGQACQSCPFDLSAPLFSFLAFWRRSGGGHVPFGGGIGSLTSSLSRKELPWAGSPRCSPSRQGGVEGTFQRVAVGMAERACCGHSSTEKGQWERSRNGQSMHARPFQHIPTTTLGTAVEYRGFHLLDHALGTNLVR